MFFLKTDHPLWIELHQAEWEEYVRTVRKPSTAGCGKFVWLITFAQWLKFCLILEIRVQESTRVYSILLVDWPVVFHVFLANFHIHLRPCVCAVGNGRRLRCLAAPNVRHPVLILSDSLRFVGFYGASSFTLEEIQAAWLPVWIATRPSKQFLWLWVLWLSTETDSSMLFPLICFKFT